ncbi:MAG: phage major capsid protein [Gemmataceae bacterium]
MWIELLTEQFGQAAGQRVDVEETVAKAMIANGSAKAVQGNPVQDTLQAEMSKLTASMTKGLNNAINEGLKQFAKEASKSRKNGIPTIFGEGQTGDTNSTFGRFLLAVRKGDVKVLEEMGSQWTDWETKADNLTSQSGSLGGYTVPEMFLPELLTLVAEMSVVEKRATRIPMGSQTVKVPTLDVTQTPTAGDTAFLGGIFARWTEEGGTITETNPKFKQVELKAHEISGYTQASNTLLMDNALGLETLLKTLFAKALSHHKDYAFLRGNGVGKPLGMLNSNALITVSRSAASAFGIEDVANMFSRLLPGWTTQSTVWVIHPTVVAKLLTMVGSSLGGDLIFIERVQDKPRMVIFGIPVEISEKVPGLNNLGDVMLLDCQHYLVGSTQKIEIAFSEHVAFLTNEGTWRFVERCDGQPWVSSEITLADTSSTLSPFITLDAG